MTAEVADAVRAVAAWDLPGTSRFPDRPLTPAAWQALLTLVRQQKLAGLLAAAAAAGDLPTTDAQASDALQEHFDSMVAMLLLESATVRTVEVLDAAGIPTRVLKGPAVAHLDYPDPALRLFGDIDLAVPAEHFDQAVAALVAVGHSRRFPQPRPGFDHRFSKGTSFTTSQGLEIDLHRVFVMGPFGLTMRDGDLWTGSRPFRLGGRTLNALEDDVRFLHACFHAALGDVVPRLVPQRDVAQMLLSDRVDVARVLELAGTWQAEVVLARAVSTTWHTLSLPPTPLSDWAGERLPSARERRDLAVYSDPGGSYAGKSLAAARVLPTWRQRAAFCWALALPDRHYRRSRSGHRWRRAWKAARRMGSAQ